MRIITLKAENVKRLRAVEITPEGDVVVVAGRNAQGKSSVLDAIWMALAGAAGAKETTRPIRDGEKQASVELDLGDLVVTRKWTEAGTTLSVAAADGAKYPSPQSVLDGLIGRLTFDPLAFAESSQKEQLAMLLSVVELPFDPEKVAMERAGVFDERTNVNREVGRLEGVLSEIGPVEVVPDEEVSAAALSAELQKALTYNNARDDLVRQMNENDERLVALREEIAQREERGAALAERIGDPIDTAALQEKIAQADLTNELVRIQREHARISRELTVAKEQADTLTNRLIEIDARKAKALQEATMPLDGLSFDDEGVLYSGVPFSQVSASEKLRASMAIAMALNPKIRVLRITDGSLLDSENMALISEMAAERDFQVWIERVDESGMVGVTIEDGAVAG